MCMERTRYFILLALSKEPLYPYAIREQIVIDTVGHYVKDGTL